MADLFKAKLRKIGGSIGILIPQEQLMALNVAVDDEVEIAVLKHRSYEELRKEAEKSFGIAKGAGPFERDKKVREF